MKNLYALLLAVIAYLFIPCNRVAAQCGAGYTAATLNWDNLDFLPSANTEYTDWYTSSSIPYTQNFAMGTRRVTFTMASSSNFTLDGENAINTAHSGSFATAGEDVEFTTTTNGNRTITMSMDSNVTNLRYSIFDLDNTQRVTITATNLAGASQIITIVRASGSSTISITGSGTNTAVATGPGSNYADNDNRGTINVTIAGPVKNVVMTLSNNSGDIWLSDINACVTGAFVNNWRNVSRPFTGMPSYIITVLDNEFYMLDPATGKATLLFTDPAHTNMNGLAYDPVNRYVYYGYSLTSSPSTTRTIYRYRIDTDVKSTFIADINTGAAAIPSYEPGVTSGSATFYNGSLYFGVESSNRDRNSGRENTVWRIDIDGSLNPTRATQIYATRVDSSISGNDELIHDWSDIGVTNNGMLYDFDGAKDDSMYYHFNMMTGQRVQYLPTGTGNIGPKQMGINWQETVYNMGGLPSGAPLTIGGYIAPYNYNGTVNNAQNRLVYTLPGPTYLTGSWGDCGEAFRPLCDFGDAPATYDPDPWSPAVHERDISIRIGATWDREWNKTSSSPANADGADEDGLATVPIFSRTANTYLAQVSVYNNTGSTATLIAWLDYNGNGVFNTGEACQTIPAIPSSPSMQTRYLYWPTAPTLLPNGSYTYLRIRLVRTASGMTNANPTGYYDNGETEDYRVLVDNFPLAVNMLSFDAKVIADNKVKLNWSANEDAGYTIYEVQRSNNGTEWNHFAFVDASQAAGIKNYELTDGHPYKGQSYYRLKLGEDNGVAKYSPVRTVIITDLASLVSIFPNPAKNNTTINIYNSTNHAISFITVMDMQGNKLLSRQVILRQGDNPVNLPLQASWPTGMYVVQVSSGTEITNKKLLINR